MDYCECGNEMDQDCNGNPRCDVCDPPCPCCNDGGMDAQDNDDELDAELAADLILERQELEDFEGCNVFEDYDVGGESGW